MTAPHGHKRSTRRASDILAAPHAPKAAQLSLMGVYSTPCCPLECLLLCLSHAPAHLSCQRLSGSVDGVRRQASCTPQLTCDARFEVERRRHSNASQVSAENMYGYRVQRVYNNSAPLEHALVRQSQDAYGLTPSLPALCMLGIPTSAQRPPLPRAQLCWK